MKKIVITGGAGFVGSQVGYYFQNKNFDITLIDNMSYGKEDNLSFNNKKIGKFFNADVREKSTMSLIKGADYVFHFAGIAPLPDCQIDPVGAYENNVIGTINILDACRQYNVPKVIFSSTSAVYENCNNFPLRESSIDVDPDLIYSMSKLSCEKICNSYVKNYGMDITCLRFFNVYGPHQDFKRKQPPLMGYITKSLLLNETPIFYSSGEQKRDYIFIDDISRIIENIIDSNNSAGEIFNACSGISYSVREIYELYRSHFEKSNDPVFKPSHNFWDKYEDLFAGSTPLKKERVIKEVDKYSLGSLEKSEKLLGWSPTITMEMGIAECVIYAKEVFQNQVIEK